MVGHDTLPSLQRAGVVAAPGRAVRPTMQLFGIGGPPKEKLPPGWKKVKSRSRPGKFSYENVKTGQRYDRLPQVRVKGDFYDDDRDTTAKPLWNWKQQEEEEEFGGFRSAQEQAGFSASGGDLSTEGGVLYVAFIPFLLFFLFYVFGNIGSPYSGGGNFK